MSWFIHTFDTSKRFFIHPARNVNQLPCIRHANYFLTALTRLRPFLVLVNGTTTYTSTICCAPDFSFYSFICDP